MTRKSLTLAFEWTHSHPFKSHAVAATPFLKSHILDLLSTITAYQRVIKQYLWNTWVSWVQVLSNHILSFLKKRVGFWQNSFSEKYLYTRCHENVIPIDQLICYWYLINNNLRRVAYDVVFNYFCSFGLCVNSYLYTSLCIPFWW